MLRMILIFFFILVGCSDFSRGPVTKPASEEQNGRSADKPSALPPEFTNPNQAPFTEKKLLVNLGTKVFAKQAELFSLAAEQLPNSIAAFCRSLKSDRDLIETEQQMNSDFKRVIMSFHILEGAPFGPLIEKNRELFDQIYSYPYLNSCGLDQKVVEQLQNQLSVPDFTFNLKGLGAVEYLLFEKQLMSKCNLRAFPQLKEWNARPLLQKRSDRCQLALLIANDISEKAKIMSHRWSVDHGNYTLKLVDQSLYRDLKASINAITDGLSHIENLKDLKLGRPLGRHKECAEEKCPEAVEHPFSDLALESIKSQLLGFRWIFTGAQDPEVGFGFDDLLQSLGQETLARRLVEAVDRALVQIQLAQGLGSMTQQIQSMSATECKATTISNRKVPICALHEDIRLVAKILKTEVLVALSLRAPPTHQGDND